MSTDPIIDAFKLGLGAADLTREEAEKIVAQLQSKYKDDIKDGRAMVDELLRQAKTNSDKIQMRVNKEVDRAIKEQDLVSKKEIEELRRAIETLASVSTRVTSRAIKKAAKRTKAKKAAKAKPKKRK